MDEFVPIPDCDGYFINKNGEILSKIKNKAGKILKTQKEKTGYIKIILRLDKKPKTLRVHRLLALTFIDNPNNYNIVDHINRNREDNRLDNLRWVDCYQNNHNRSMHKDNKCGHKNIVSDTKKNGKTYYLCRIQHKGKSISKGFTTLEEAIVHRDKKLKELNREII